MNRYRCPGCGYVYDESVGDAHEGFAPGTPKHAIADSLSCPDCGVRDFVDFELIAPVPTRTG
jgi:rubredoxin